MSSLVKYLKKCVDVAIINTNDAAKSVESIHCIRMILCRNYLSINCSLWFTDLLLVLWCVENLYFKLNLVSRQQHTATLRYVGSIIIKSSSCQLINKSKFHWRINEDKSREETWKATLHFQPPYNQMYLIIMLNTAHNRHF